jgi:hypothetical protein
MPSEARAPGAAVIVARNWKIPWDNGPDCD